MSHIAISLRAIAVAAFACLASNLAQAGEDNTPFSLTLAHDIARDSNFSKTTVAQGETVNTSSAKVGFDKGYGRQTYNLGAKLTTARHAHNTQLDNNGKMLNAAFGSGLLSNWNVRLTGIYDENLNQIQNNDLGGRLDKNIRKYQDTGFSVQYGNGGTWAMIGSLDTNKTRYSIQPENNADQDSRGFKAVYYSSDALNFGLGSRLVSTKYIGRADLVQTDKNIDMSVDWRVTGLTDLSAVLTRRSSSYNNENYTPSKGFGGELAWRYTPSGLLNYGLTVNRTTGSDRQKTGFNYEGADVLNLADTVSTSVALSTQLRLTSKIYLSAVYSVVNYTQDNNYTGLDKNLTSDSKGRRLALDGTYEIMRSLRTGCGYALYDQTLQEGRNLFNQIYVIRPKYSGRSVSCNVNFTID
ncbi:MAG: hypothetical protein Q7U28_18530 [Aquabacterium sp.]|nr:hypothetical protein [Aquabacterium sp.]